MRFELTAEQSLIRESMRSYLSRAAPVSYLRWCWEHDERSPAIWEGLANLGMTAALIPERYQGLGLGETDIVLALEEAGRAALPEPILDSVFVGTPLLRDAGSEQQREEWLPKLASGHAVVAVVLEGQRFVADADRADIIIVEEQGELHLVPPSALALRRQPCQDRSRRLFDVTVDVRRGTKMPERRGRAFERAVVGNAAMLIGIGGQLLGRTIEYAKTRLQFARPIGSFQAVKHRLADVFCRLETARLTVLWAAYALEHQLDSVCEAAAVAGIAAGQAERASNLAALQIHGGTGFTWENDLHLWLKRGIALERAWGRPVWHRARLATLLDSPND
jgi:alkylation response protein AidB-like acyl-CoA dehydrogenase